MVETGWHFFAPSEVAAAQPWSARVVVVAVLTDVHTISRACTDCVRDVIVENRIVQIELYRLVSRPRPVAVELQRAAVRRLHACRTHHIILNEIVHGR